MRARYGAPPLLAERRELAIGRTPGLRSPAQDGTTARGVARSPAHRLAVDGGDVDVIALEDAPPAVIGLGQDFETHFAVAADVHAGRQVPAQFPLARRLPGHEFLGDAQGCQHIRQQMHLAVIAVQRLQTVGGERDRHVRVTLAGRPHPAGLFGQRLIEDVDAGRKVADRAYHRLGIGEHPSAQEHDDVVAPDGQQYRPGPLPANRHRQFRGLHRRMDQTVADGEVEGPVVDVVLGVPGLVPDGSAGQGDRRVARLAGPVAELDVVPLDEERQGQADLVDRLEWDQTGPPAVEGRRDDGLLPLFLQIDAVAVRLVRGCDGEVDGIEHLAGRPEGGRAQPLQHVRPDQRRGGRQ